MQEKDEGFKLVVPIYLQKGEKDKWKIAGIASTLDKDKQGEIVDLNGLDLTPIKEGKGYFNWDHNNDPASLLGSITGYKIDPKIGLYVEGYLFKNHAKAKAVHEILSSLEKADTGKLGMSIEGVIRERGGKDGKVIRKATIHNVAITACPVNTKTYLDLVKSFSGGMEFLSSELHQELEQPEQAAIFTSKQVLELLEKALSAGAGYSDTLPQNLSQGETLQQEDLEHDRCPNCKKIHSVDSSCKKSTNLMNPNDALIPQADTKFFKSIITDVFQKIAKLYPEVDETDLWGNVKERLFAKFPSINTAWDDDLVEDN